MYRMVSLLIIVPFLLFSLLISYIHTIKLENVISDSLYAVANSQIAEMTDFCEHLMNNVTIIGDMDVSHAALHVELNKDTLQYLDNILYSQVQMTAYLESLAIIDADYRVIACSEAGYEVYAQDGIEPLVERMGEKKFYISDVLISDSNVDENKSVVAIAKIEEDGKILGYTLAEMNLDFYNSIRERAKLWNEATFYLLDGKQQIISAGTPEDGRQSFVTTAEEREDYIKKYNSIDFETNPQGSFTYKVGEKNYITYYSAVDYTDWRVMLTVNIDNYLAQRTIYGVLAFFLAMLCTALAVWIGAFTSKRIVRPIKRISDTLNNIQQKQDYSLRVEVMRKDELGNLSMEINGLLEFIETENLYKAQQQRLLQQKAEQDALTKVSNKERISQYLQEAVDRHRAERTAMAVLFVDVDDFKSFNTSHGHGVGDQVLLFLTSLLSRETRGSVGRVGGDEFLVIVEEPWNLSELDSCLEQVNKVSDSQFVIRGTGECLPVTCCIGAVRVDFSVPGSEDLTADQLVNMADTAMYQVKNSGKRGYKIVDWEE